MFNGKFNAGGLNGVHRVADRLIRECDGLLAAIPVNRRPKARLLVPERRRWEPKLRGIELVPVVGADSQKWEQIGLPTAAGDAVIVNLANLAPVRATRQILLLHDAQFLFPDSGYPLRQRLGYRLLTPVMARRSATVLTVSHYSRQMLDLLGVAPRGRSAVLYNGADHILDVRADDGALAQLGLTRGGYALMFGSPKGYKNNQVVFDAFGDGAAQVRLVVVGAEAAALTAAGLTVPAGALFAGRCDDAALRALYDGAHSLLVPSRTEGFGLPPMEAMLCGCPVIVAPAGALPEMCRDAALYADVDDAASWRAAIRTLDDPAVRHAKIAAGRERASHFTWARAGGDLLRHILRLGAE
ncbi:glycosyltransferase family 4 protein [Sphingomonas radiodurans]|uniref:glycosyltransferase family 4 protein n=1 Tax=Sphingomonas radiodurans TaxID=2890321 RepID=UPI001E5034D6|nr:glycosyltransferase family 1 protein [Sphingomonas radiodurans]WBH17093.1 glycosyltransferase family 1 protein [Sphingomonas radiodurans]